MLNPLAHEFSPTTFLPETKLTSHENKNRNAKKPPKEKKKGVTTEDIENKKDKGKEVVRKSQSKDKPPKDRNKINENKSSKGGGNKDTKEPTRKKRDSFQSNNTRKKSAPTAVISPNEFEQESPFIAIETAIDPVHRLDNTANTGDNRRKQSLTHDIKKQYEHGYERYIDWIDRSLQAYGIVTVVGMDKAIVDVISLVTILQDRKIGEHQDIETFTMNQGNKPTSCIQVKLHSFYLYK